MNTLTNLKNMDNITQEQINAYIEFIDNTEEPASVTNVMAAAILAFLNLKVRQMVTVDDLNNEATARENTDTLLQGLIDALNRTAVRYSDVGEVIAELSTGTGMLLPDQSPLVIFKSMGAAYDGVQRTVTLYEGEASYPGSGNNYRYNKRGTVYPDMTVTSNRVYFNSYTGRLYKWAGSSFEAIGGGMDGAIYDIIKSNVNLVAAKLDTLIGALAMLAFSGTVNKELLKVGSLSWVEPETHEPRIITPLDGSTIEFGNSTEDDEDIQIELFIEGADLTEALTLSITEGSSRFRLGSGSSSIAAATANGGTTIYLYYNSSSSVANATGKLNIHSSEVDVNVNLHGTYSEQGGGDPVDPESYQVSAGTLSHVQITETLPATVSSGGSFTGHLVADTDNGYSLPSSIAVSGTHGAVSYDQSSGVFTIPNITSNVAISATAVPSGQQDGYIQTDLVLHLDGENRGNSAGHWIDTIGNRDFVLNEACVEDPEVTFDALDITKEFSGVKFEQVNNVYAAGMYTIPSGTTDPVHINSINNDNWTIEVVFTPIGSQWWAVNHGFFAQCDTTASSAYGLLCAVFQSVSSGKKMVFSSANSSENIRRDVTSLVTEQAGEPFAQGCLMRVSQNKDALVVNGSQVNVELNAGTIGYDMISGGPQAMRIGMLLNSFGGNDSAKAVIHEIRVYTSKLTVAQMQANQAIDLQRYGGN